MTFSADAFTRLYSQAAFNRIILPEQKARGLMVAICAAPEIPLPETWMPWFIYHSGEEPRLADEIIDDLAQALMHCLRDTLNTMRHDGSLLPQQTLATDEPDESLSLWLNGLLAGHQHLEPVWQSAWLRAQQNPGADDGLNNTEDPAKRLKRCLKMFSTLADIEQAYQNRTPAQQVQLKKHIPALLKQLPQMLREYIQLAGELASFLPNQFEMFEGKADN